MHQTIKQFDTAPFKDILEIINKNDNCADDATKKEIQNAKYQLSLYAKQTGQIDICQMYDKQLEALDLLFGAHKSEQQQTITNSLEQQTEECIDRSPKDDQIQHQQISIYQESQQQIVLTNSEQSSGVQLFATLMRSNILAQKEQHLRLTKLTDAVNRKKRAQNHILGLILNSDQ